jgi:hypothetical protein
MIADFDQHRTTSVRGRRAFAAFFSLPWAGAVVYSDKSVVIARNDREIICVALAAD